MALREFDSVKVGDQLPERVIPLTRGDLVNYAGVSGDLNPIHWDDEIAKQVGLDTAIAHGMLTMGLGGGYVTSWVGDPAAVTEYNVRFTAVVPVPNDGVGAEIVFNGRVKSVDAESKSIDHRAVRHDRGKEDLRPRHRDREAGVAHGTQDRHPGDGRIATPTPSSSVASRSASTRRAIKSDDPATFDEAAAAELGHDDAHRAAHLRVDLRRDDPEALLRERRRRPGDHADRPGRPEVPSSTGRSRSVTR